MILKPARITWPRPQDGQLPDTGFRFQIAFNTGNTTRQTIAEIFQAELGAINPNYIVESIGLPWPTFLSAQRASQLPVSVSAWLEDIRDPHNWVQPSGQHLRRSSRYAGELMDEFRVLVDAGVQAADPGARQDIYYELQQVFYDNVPQIILHQRSTPWYTQPWVDGYYYRVGGFGRDYYAYSLATE
ncbi:MAG: hypothetical protein R3C44_19790 [Chloroflexota bacterium]